MSAHIQNFAAAVVLLVTAGVTPTSALEEVKPFFWVENDSIEIGRVVAGHTASATFVFHNDGEIDVHIVHATPS
jgi:ABC-type tungstate transport system permease subunit